MNYQFEEPGSGGQGDRFSAEQAQNRRLIVVPIEYIPMMQVSGGRETDAIKLNVVDLQGGDNLQTGVRDEAGAAYQGCLWFGGRLIGAFRNSLGKMFVGYVGKERTSGGFQAWQFYSLTQDQQTVDLATAWLQHNPDFMEKCQHQVHDAQTRYLGQQGGEPRNQFQQGQAGYPPAQPASGQWLSAQQQGPAPVQPPSPPQPSGPAPMPAQPPLPPPTSAPPAPQSPAPADLPPANQTVMERLRAQREQEQAQPQGNMPY